MENQEYVFEEKAEIVGDEIIIGDVEFKLEANKGNTSFGEIEPQGDISVGTNQLDTPLGSVVLEGSIAHVPQLLLQHSPDLRKCAVRS